MASMDPDISKGYPTPRQGHTVVVFPDGSHEQRESKMKVSDLLNPQELVQVASGELKVEGVLDDTSQILAIAPSNISWKSNIPHVTLSANAWLPKTGVLVLSEG